MKIEVLYDEFYIFGEKANVEYLKRMFSEEAIHETSFGEVPYFTTSPVDAILLGPMQESNLARVTKELMPYRDKLKERIEEGVLFVAINNALDILGRSLEVVEEGEEPTLSLFGYTAVRDYTKRYSELFVADWAGQEVIGERMGFSQYYGNESCAIYTSKTGKGFNHDTNLGGYRYKNAFLIDALGVLLVTNPPLARRLFSYFGMDKPLPFEKEAEEAYNNKLNLLKTDFKLS